MIMCPSTFKHTLKYECDISTCDIINPHHVGGTEGTVIIFSVCVSFTKISGQITTLGC